MNHGLKNKMVGKLVGNNERNLEKEAFLDIIEHKIGMQVTFFYIPLTSSRYIVSN